MSNLIFLSPVSGMHIENLKLTIRFAVKVLTHENTEPESPHHKDLLKVYGNPNYFRETYLKVQLHRVR